MKTRESQRLITGILSLVLITGLGTPAFAQTLPPTSDIVRVTTVLGDVLTCTFPESTETPSLIGLGPPSFCSPPFGFGFGAGSGVVVFTEPGSAVISDILLLQPQPSNLCSTSALCFVSDDDSTALQGILNAITTQFPSLPVTFIEETGSLQDVTGFLNLVPADAFRVSVQSDVEPIVGGEILSLDMTALFVAGIFTNSFWVLPTFGGIAGAAVALFKIKRRHS